MAQHLSEIELLRLKVSRLEEELQEAQSTIKKICQWIQSQHGIIIPSYLVDLESRICTGTGKSTSSPVLNESTIIDFIEEIKIKNDKDEEQADTEDFQYETNFNIKPSDFDLDIDEPEENPFEFESEPEETIVKENHGSKPCSSSSKLCRPCIVLLVPLQIDDGQPQQPFKKKRKLYSSGFHTKNKIKPTEEEKDQAIKLCQDRSYINRVFIFCPICPQRFSGSSKKGLFKTHLVTIHYFTKVDLEKCKYDDNLTLTKYYITHVETSNSTARKKRKKPYNFKDERASRLCITCGKIFRSINYFNIHNIKMHSNIEPSFKCDICQASFHFEKELIKHKKSHTDEKNHLCPTCGSAFKRLDTLQCHLLTHSEDRLYKCTNVSENGENCDRTFKQIQALQIHKKRFHSVGGQVKNHICDKCSLAFLYKNQLKRHIEGVHDHKRPYSCHICPKSFKCSANLKYHINTHSNPNSKYRGYNKPK